jgi:hypothetical protein
LRRILGTVLDGSKYVNNDNRIDSLAAPYVSDANAAEKGTAATQGRYYKTEGSFIIDRNAKEEDVWHRPAARRAAFNALGFIRIDPDHGAAGRALI